MVFQLTIRAVACREIADSPEAVARVENLYWDMEKGSAVTAILLPWLPSPARRRKVKATTDLYLMLKGILDKRIEEGRTEEDPAQALLDDGNSVNDIVTFIMGALFAGISMSTSESAILSVLNVQYSQLRYHGLLADAVSWCQPSLERKSPQPDPQLRHEVRKRRL